MLTQRLTHYRNRIAEKGVGGMIRDRLRAEKKSFQMDNWVVGRWVELTGNTVKLDGVTLSVDNPLVTTRHKSTLYFGIYEIDEWRLIKRHLDCSIPTIELGGSIGGIACRTNRLLENRSAHVVVECNPTLLPTLRRNKELNHSGFIIEPYAIGYDGSEISFTITDHFMLSAVDHGPAGKRVSVPATTLAEIIERHGYDRINLICDIEGAETEMVEREGDVLFRHAKRFILETHVVNRGQEQVGKTIRAIMKLGFDLIESSRDTHAFYKLRA